jgi:hypothetical protein
MVDDIIDLAAIYRHSAPSCAYDSYGKGAKNIPGAS